MDEFQRPLESWLRALQCSKIPDSTNESTEGSHGILEASVEFLYTVEFMKTTMLLGSKTEKETWSKVTEGGTLTVKV